MERMWLFHEELRISSSSTAHPCPFLGLTLAPAHDTSVSDIWARRNDAALDAAQPAYNTRPTAPGKAASSNSPAPTCTCIPLLFYMSELTMSDDELDE